MALSADEFVQAVMKRLDASSPAQLAEKMRWKRGTERLVAKWLAGSAKPGYGYTMELLEAAGWLAIDETTATRPLTEDEVAMARRAHAELSGLLERLQEVTGE